MSDDDLLRMYGPNGSATGQGTPAPLDQAKAAIPPNAAGQIELLASSRQLPDKIANVSIQHISDATGADPAALRSYYDAFKTRPVSGDEAFAQGAKSGVTLGLGPAIGGAVDAAVGERPFAQGMASRVADLKAAEAQHPYATLGGQVAGTVAGLAPIAATGAGATALGLTGENMLTRTLASGGTNALLGGAGAAVESGGDPAQTLRGAEFGGVFGLGGPYAGKALGKGVNMLTGALGGNPLPGPRAANALIDALGGQEGIAAAQSELARNPRLALMDVNPNAQQIAGGLASKPGQARATLNEAYQSRAATAPNAVSGAYDAALGATPDTKALLDQLQATARQNAEKGFGEALKDAKPVDVSGVIKAIDDKVSPGIGQIVSQGSNLPRGPVEDALMRVRAQLTDGKSTLTDANALHGIQQDLRTTAETLGKSANGQDKLTATALRDVRGTVNGAIDDATGGKFKPAQKQFADDMSVKDAFDKGLDIFRNRAGSAGLEDRPESWRAAISEMSPDELTALKQGVRVAADQKIGSVRNAARAGEAITDSDMNLDKLSAILGDKEAGQLAQSMKDEQRIAQTNSILFHGSQTEPRRQGALATAVREATPLSMEVGIPSLAFAHNNPWWGAGLAAAAVGRRGLQFGAQRSDLARNNLLANYLSAGGNDALPAFAAMNNRLTAQGGFGRAVGRTGNLLIDAIGANNLPEPIGDFRRPK